MFQGNIRSNNNILGQLYSRVYCYIFMTKKAQQPTSFYNYVKFKIEKYRLDL